MSDFSVHLNVRSTRKIYLGFKKYLGVQKGITYGCADKMKIRMYLLFDHYAFYGQATKCRIIDNVISKDILLRNIIIIADYY